MSEGLAGASYVSIRQHSSAFVQHTSTYVTCVSCARASWGFPSRRETAALMRSCRCPTSPHTRSPRPPPTGTCQYLYFCTSKASKLSTCACAAPIRITSVADKAAKSVGACLGVSDRGSEQPSRNHPHTFSVTPPTHTLREPRLLLAHVSIRQHASAYAATTSISVPPLRIRQHTSAYVSIRQHTPAYVSIRCDDLHQCTSTVHMSAYVSIRQHTSAYVSIRQHMSAYAATTSISVPPPCRSSSQLFIPYVSIRQHTTAYDSIRQHTSEYVSIRQHTTCMSVPPLCRSPSHTYTYMYVGR
jgi:hypothetical protein